MDLFQREIAQTQLLEGIETWCKVIEEQGDIDVIYIDFAKAFDAAPHKRLMWKVKSYGFKGDLLNWIKSFLTNRRQRVKVGGINIGLVKSEKWSSSGFRFGSYFVCHLHKRYARSDI